MPSSLTVWSNTAFWAREEVPQHIWHLLVNVALWTPRIWPTGRDLYLRLWWGRFILEHREAVHSFAWHSPCLPSFEYICICWWPVKHLLRPMAKPPSFRSSANLCFFNMGFFLVLAMESTFLYRLWSPLHICWRALCQASVNVLLEQFFSIWSLGTSRKSMFLLTGSKNVECPAGSSEGAKTWTVSPRTGLKNTKPEYTKQLFIL